MRVFALSDLHTDFAENRRRLQRISSTARLRGVLVVAGDIADDLRIIDWTLRKFIMPSIIREGQGCRKNL
jgi:hypothetical protein